MLSVFSPKKLTWLDILLTKLPSNHLSNWHFYWITVVNLSIVERNNWSKIDTIDSNHFNLNEWKNHFHYGNDFHSEKRINLFGLGVEYDSAFANKSHSNEQTLKTIAIGFDKYFFYQTRAGTRAPCAYNHFRCYTKFIAIYNMDWCIQFCAEQLQFAHTHMVSDYFNEIFKVVITSVLKHFELHSIHFILFLKYPAPNSPFPIL